jgi:serine/threonine protein kinase
MLGALLGNYRITTQLSHGAMGTVYRAQHALLDRPAAVKLLRPELTASDELVQRFFNEAQAATKIRHPGIVEVYDFGYTDDGVAYLVMELLEGATLSKRLVERGRLPEVDAAFIARGIASALKAAHYKGIIHRDLKPDNVFLVPDPDGPTGERVKILDFGIAKLADVLPGRHQTQTGALIGTPLYMAPEQARAARTIDHRADLYSLGCILYEMLVGAPPFVAEGAGEVIALHLFNQPEPPSKRAAVSLQMDAIVMRLLAKEPDQRFETAKDVVEALTVAGGLAPQVSGQYPLAPESRPNIAVPAVPAVSPRLFDAAAVPLPVDKRSSMALIAGIITLVIAAAVAIFVLTHGDDDDDDEGPAPPPSGSQTGSQTEPPPVTPARPARPARAKVPIPDLDHERARPTPVERPDHGKRPSPPPAPHTGPVTRPDRDSTGPVVSPKGLVTPNGSPIEPTLDDPPKPLDAAGSAGGN